ncbi:MAG: polyprenol monophosphomannose synthase [Desulfurococcaceae archaeon]
MDPRINNGVSLKVSIIIPTYNERENIAVLIDELAKYVSKYSYEIIVIDDNSPDGTADIAESLSKRYPIKVLRRPCKMGLTSAIYDGFSISNGDILVVMDADLQHPPSVVPRLVERAQECELVVASRYTKSGGTEKWSSLRKMISRGAIVLAWLIIPECRGVKDAVSGFFAVRRELISKWRPIVPNGYKALVEILASAKPSRVCEEPYTFRARARGGSKLGLKVILSYMKLLFVLKPAMVLSIAIVLIVMLGLIIYIFLNMLT